MSEAVCPKCGTENIGSAKACPKCGLLVERWSTYTPPVVEPHPVIDAAFDKLTMRWDDAGAHDAFLTLAQAERALDAAAARYRRRARELPDDALAARGLERVALLAAHQQANAPREPLRGLQVVNWLATVIALAVVAVVAAIAWRIFGRH